MTAHDRLPTLRDLTDELLVVATLLEMMTQSRDSVAEMLEQCAAAAGRCQVLVATLVHLEGP